MYKINQKIIRQISNLDDKIIKNMKIQIKSFSSFNRYKSVNNLNKSNNNSIYKIEKKNFFGFFKSKIDNYDDIIFDKKKNKKGEDWYEVTETVVFQDGRHPILKASDKEIRMVKIFEWVLLLPAMVLSGYKLVKSLILLRPFRSIFWGGIFFISGRLYRGATQNKHFFIYSIHLLEDGKKLEVGKEGGKLIADISNVRRLTQEEALYFAQTMPDAHLSYIPIIIEDQFYLIFKNSTVIDKEIFAAISSGKYIKVKAENIINKEDAIDVDGK